jgi:hypothetical protein
MGISPLWREDAKLIQRYQLVGWPAASNSRGKAGENPPAYRKASRENTEKEPGIRI